MYCPISTDDIVHETAKAICIEVKAPGMRGTYEPIWLPKSQIVVRQYEGNHSIIEMPEWLAQEKYLIAKCDDEFHPDVIDWQEI